MNRASLPRGPQPAPNRVTPPPRARFGAGGAVIAIGNSLGSFFREADAERQRQRAAQEAEAQRREAARRERSIATNTPGVFLPAELQAIDANVRATFGRDPAARALIYDVERSVTTGLPRSIVGAPNTSADVQSAANRAAGWAAEKTGLMSPQQAQAFTQGLEKLRRTLPSPTVGLSTSNFEERMADLPGPIRDELRYDPTTGWGRGAQFAAGLVGGALLPGQKGGGLARGGPRGSTVAELAVRNSNGLPIAQAHRATFRRPPTPAAGAPPPATGGIIAPRSRNALDPAIGYRRVVESDSVSEQAAHGRAVFSQPLTDAQKKALREALREAGRKDWRKKNGVPATDLAAHIHHTMPLEWAHLFPRANPARYSNLLALPPKVHDYVTKQWGMFKRGLGGREPTQAELMKQKLWMERKTIEYIVTPKASPPPRAPR
jgi:hypothetical protein